MAETWTVQTETWTLRIHDEGGGGYHLWAEVVELPGCFASGRDIGELAEALIEALAHYLAEAPRHG